MKHLRKFNESNNSEINEESIYEIFSQGVNVTIPMSDLLLDTNIFIVTEDGSIYEYDSGRFHEARNFWESNEEFKKQTGASLDDEYAQAKSDELLRFMEEKIDDYRVGHIKAIYFQGGAGKIISKLLNI